MSAEGTPPEGPFDADADPAQVEAFVRKITANRDRELGRIDEQLATRSRALRTSARARARSLAREIVERTRENENRLDARHLYRVRSELARERWEALARYRAQAATALRERFAGLWRDPALQAGWCRFWVDAARRSCAGQALLVRCGAGSAETLPAEIGRWLQDHPGGARVDPDPALPAGLVIEWPDHLLDGTVETQCQAALETVMQRLARLLDGTPADAGAGND